MSSIRQNSQDPQENNKVFITLLFIVFVLPWPHGGELVWQYLIFCISFFSFGVIYLINSTKATNNIQKEFSVLKSIKTPLNLLGVWLLFQVIQIIPLPIELSKVAEQNLIKTNWQTISIAPNVTLIEIIKHTSYITVFILTLLLINTKQRVLLLANTLFFGSAMIALYSIVNHFNEGAFSLISSIPPWTAPWGEVAHGTFSYQNHYASFLTLTIPLGYGLLYLNIKSNINQKVETSNIAKVINLFMSINGVYLLSLLLMIIAIFKTASRGGNSILMVSIVITFLYTLYQQKTSTKEKTKKIGLWIITILTISVIAIASGVTDTLIKRLNSQGYTPNGRYLMHKTALAIVQERPLVGIGAGNYPIVQQKFKSPLLGSTAMSKRAHNDYLELLANQGIIGFSLLSTAIFLLYIRLLNGLKKSRNKQTNSFYGLQIASFCSVTAILLHSLADFNFHLPVNAVYFYLILALGLRVCFLNETTKKNRKS